MLEYNILLLYLTYRHAGSILLNYYIAPDMLLPVFLAIFAAIPSLGGSFLGRDNGEDPTNLPMVYSEMHEEDNDDKDCDGDVCMGHEFYLDVKNNVKVPDTVLELQLWRYFEVNSSFVWKQCAPLVPFEVTH